VDARTVSRALLRAAEAGPPRLDVLDGPPPGARKVGLVPGSFDPVTRAHAALAVSIRSRGADLVLMTYSPRTLPKPPGGEPPLMTPERRLAALGAWCAANGGIAPAVCFHGLIADQVEAAAAAFPGADLVVGVGSDKILQLFDPSWYEDRTVALDSLFGRARVAFAPRAHDEAELGSILKANPRWAAGVDRLQLPEGLRPLSSSQVRGLIRRGVNVSALVPPEVLPFLPAADGC
jgi:nicotinic acid mononucleotide adenylyltransferase